jgi:hypothetical protein
VAAGDNGKQYRVIVSNGHLPDAVSNVVANMLTSVSSTDRQIVISQVYGAGGNTGASYQNDYIELCNKGTTAVDVTGWSVQYASSTGDTWAKTDLTGTIQPGRYYLIREADGNACGGAPCGEPLPKADASGTSAINASAGKVALVKSGVLLIGACPKMDCRVLDFVGYGASANCFEGALGPAPSASENTKAVFRKGGCAVQDSGENKNDFEAGAASPRNSASTICLCHTPFADADGDGDVDQDDFAAFQACFTGSGGGILTNPAYPCLCFDRDAPTPDHDVDVDDYASFMNCLTGSGPNIPWTLANNPNCVP